MWENHIDVLGEAILTATHIMNRILTSHNFGLYPFEKLYGHTPDYSTLCVFGCTCFDLKPHVERTKLSAKFPLCVFLGYGLGQKGYHCFDLVNQKLYVSRHVVFLNIFRSFLFQLAHIICLHMMTLKLILLISMTLHLLSFQLQNLS